MKLANAQTPPPLARPALFPATLVYAALITVCTTAQLFTLDQLYEHPLFTQPFGAALLPAMILTAIFSLPSILNLTISRLMRYCSLVLASMLPFLWTAFALYTQPAIDTLGLLGTHLHYASLNWAIVILGYLLAIVSLYALVPPRLKK